jgi:futalosine hydrolase
MKILIVSATERDINLVLQGARNIKKKELWLNSFSFEANDIDFLVTGVGLVSTIYRLVMATQIEKYDLIINIGTAGSFKDTIQIGEVVNVFTEQFGDAGVEDNEKFLTFFEMGLANNSSKPFSNGRLLNNSDILKYKTISNLNKVNGLTVNRVSGSNETITERMVKFNPDIETSEGAAVFYISLLHDIQFIELRAISNKIEPRNTKNWNIPLALTNLNKTLLEVLTEILKW